MNGVSFVKRQYSICLPLPVCMSPSLSLTPSLSLPLPRFWDSCPHRNNFASLLGDNLAFHSSNERVWLKSRQEIIIGHATVPSHRSAACKPSTINNSIFKKNLNDCTACTQTSDMCQCVVSFRPVAESVFPALLGDRAREKFHCRVGGRRVDSADRDH